MKLLVYNVDIVHRPGRDHIVPDTSSRAYENQVSSMDELEIVDPWYISQLNKVRDYPGRFPDWKIDGEKLFYHKPNEWIDRDRDLDAWKLVIPADSREKVLRESHGVPQAPHFGREKSYRLLSRYYYWPGIRVDSAKYVKGCLVCQQNKPMQTGPQGLMGERDHE